MEDLSIEDRNFWGKPKPRFPVMQIGLGEMIPDFQTPLRFSRQWIKTQRETYSSEEGVDVSFFSSVPVKGGAD